jgi:hypothetical protein
MKPAWRSVNPRPGRHDQVRFALEISALRVGIEDDRPLVSYALYF